jgi:assimilatory nitrate reductase catalytic subunit
MRLRTTSSIRPDTVFAPFHWSGGATINDLTNPALDPASRMPEFKTCAVALGPVPPAHATAAEPAAATASTALTTAPTATPAREDTPA